MNFRYPKNSQNDGARKSILMNKTLLQTHIDLLNECRKQNKMLEKLIELNMNDLHEIADQRDWYFEEYQKMKQRNEELREAIKKMVYK